MEAEPELIGSLHKLFKQVQDPCHIVSELRQNANDVGATAARISIEDQGFVFGYNGEDSLGAHFSSICGFGNPEGRPVGITGASLRALRDSGEITIRLTTYRLILSSEGAFVTNVDETIAFTHRALAAAPFTELDKSWCYDLAIIRVYREFEDIMLSCLLALINNDSTTFSELKERTFPKHMNVELCEYFICGDGYFDFTGRDGLLKTIKKIVPKGHWLPTIVGNNAYSEALRQLSALRNFAAYDSSISKKRTLQATNQRRISSSGSWLNNQTSFAKICNSLKTMANQIDTAAPH